MERSDMGNREYLSTGSIKTAKAYKKLLKIWNQDEQYPFLRYLNTSLTQFTVVFTSYYKSQSNYKV